MDYVGGYTLVLDMTDMDLIYEKVRQVTRLHHYTFLAQRRWILREGPWAASENQICHLKL